MAASRTASPGALTLGLLALSACAAPPEAEDALPQRVSVEYGVKRYSGNGWDTFGDDDWSTVGLTVAAEQRFQPIGFDFGFFWSEGRGDLMTRRVSLDSYETYFGLMKAIRLANDRFRIDVGCGGTTTLLSGHDTNAANGSRYDRDVYVGLYGRVAVNFRIGSDAWIGIGGRFVRGGHGDLFEGPSLEGDFEQATITLSLGE